MDQRSGCPINLSVELLGDRWSVVVLRDIMFGNRRNYRDILVNSQEGIATNILAARLKHLQAEGLITVEADPHHAQKRRISLTEMSIGLVPVMAHLGAWGVRFLPCDPDFARRAQFIFDGGPPLWSALMDQLRHLHLGAPAPATDALARLFPAGNSVPDTLTGG